jgi:hypothetical protein
LTDRQVDSLVTSLLGTADKGLIDIVITYSDGSVEEFEGSLLDASETARRFGLTVVPTPDDTIRWLRNPDSWWSE